MVIKLPGRTPASAGMNSPPELASKIVTVTMSPMPKTNILRSAAIRKFADKPRRGLAQDVRDFGGDADERVWEVFGVVLPRPDVPALGAADWHHGTAACRHHQKQQAQQNTQNAHCCPPRTAVDTSSKEYRRSMRLPLLRLLPRNPGRMRPF